MNTLGSLLCMMIGIAPGIALAGVAAGEVGVKPGDPMMSIKPIPQYVLCLDVMLDHASVVRNGSPVANDSRVPTYGASISKSGQVWTVSVPQEAYAGRTPHLVRFGFSGTDPAAALEVLEAYHPALTVLTKQQAESLYYVKGVNGAMANTCFIKVTAPNGYQIGSMPTFLGLRYREVTDDFPAEVTVGGQYGLEIWYFSSAGVFTKSGDFTIKLDTCPAAPGNRYVCRD